MSGYEQIRLSIWDDEPYALLSTEAQHLYVWTFTNVAVTSAGVYKARRELMTLHTKLTPARLDTAWGELELHLMAFYYDGYVWCRSRVRNIGTGRSRNRAKAVARDVAVLPPDHALRVAFVFEYGGESWLSQAEEWRQVVAESTEFVSLAEGIAKAFVSADTTADYASHPEPIQMGPFLSLVSRSCSRPTATSKRPASDRRARDAEIAEVWEHYLDAFYPDRRGTLPDLATHLPIVVSALRVRDVERCKLAITGLAASPYHQGQNSDGRRWTEIRYALHGNRNQNESDGERIDRMAALAAAPTVNATTARGPNVDDLIEQVQRRGQHQCDVIEGSAAA